MDPTRLLEADHRGVEDLLAQINKAEGADRTPYIEKLETALLAHMELEEKVVYPIGRPVTGKEPIVEANTEHDLARKALADVMKLAPAEPGFGAALAALEAELTHHVGEEESEMFPKLRTDGEAALDKMATPFMKLRLELGMDMPADALAKAFTKEELVAEATGAGVENASAMHKDELADALAVKMAS